MYKNKLPLELCLHILSFLPITDIICSDLSIKHAYLFYDKYHWCDLYNMPRSKMLTGNQIDEFDNEQMLCMLLYTNFEFDVWSICSTVSLMAEKLSTDNQILLQTNKNKYHRNIKYPSELYGDKYCSDSVYNCMLDVDGMKYGEFFLFIIPQNNIKQIYLSSKTWDSRDRVELVVSEQVIETITDFRWNMCKNIVHGVECYDLIKILLNGQLLYTSCFQYINFKIKYYPYLTDVKHDPKLIVHFSIFKWFDNDCFSIETNIDDNNIQHYKKNNSYAPYFWRSIEQPVRQTLYFSEYKLFIQTKKSIKLEIVLDKLFLDEIFIVFSDEYIVNRIKNIYFVQQNSHIDLLWSRISPNFSGILFNIEEWIDDISKLNIDEQSIEIIIYFDMNVSDLGLTSNSIKIHQNLLNYLISGRNFMDLSLKNIENY